MGIEKSASCSYTLSCLAIFKNANIETIKLHKYHFLRLHTYCILSSSCGTCQSNKGLIFILCTKLMQGDSCQWITFSVRLLEGRSLWDHLSRSPLKNVNISGVQNWQGCGIFTHLYCKSVGTSTYCLAYAKHRLCYERCFRRASMQQPP